MTLCAIYPGTFDPITKGHFDLIQRACQLFDKVIVAVAINARKKPWISAEHRLLMIQKLLKTCVQVEVLSCSGMLVDFAAQHQANVIIRGIRSNADFNDEWSIANMNRMMAPHLETLFLPARLEYIGVSATIVREIAVLGGNIAPFVPEEVIQQLEQWNYLNRN